MTPLPFRGVMHFESDGTPQYRVVPGTKVMLQVLRQFLQTELQAHRTPDDEQGSLWTIHIGANVVHVSYDESDHYVSVYVEHGYDMTFVPTIAARFDALLARGAHDVLFDYTRQTLTSLLEQTGECFVVLATRVCNAPHAALLMQQVVHDTFAICITKAHRHAGRRRLQYCTCHGESGGILLTVGKRISVNDRCFIFGGRSRQVSRDLLAQRIRHPLRFLRNGFTEKTHVASEVLFEKQLNNSTWRSRRGERTRCARKCPHYIVEAEQHAVAIDPVKVV